MSAVKKHLALAFTIITSMLICPPLCVIYGHIYFPTFKKMINRLSTECEENNNVNVCVLCCSHVYRSVHANQWAPACHVPLYYFVPQIVFSVWRRKCSKSATYSNQLTKYTHKLSKKEIVTCIFLIKKKNTPNTFKFLSYYQTKRIAALTHHKTHNLSINEVKSFFFIFWLYW